jgi:subtilisin family serine protease
VARFATRGIAVALHPVRDARDGKETTMNTFTLCSRVAATGLLSLALAGSALGAGQIERAERPIAGRYLVVLDDGAVSSLAGESAAQALGRTSNEIAQLAGGAVDRVWSSALRGFAFEGDAWSAGNLLRDPRVARVAEDGRVELSGGLQTPTPSWGLDRIDQRTSELDSEYAYQQDGAGVDLYVVDSGIRATHVDFSGRVDTVAAFTAIEDGLGTGDCNGHGTHVAGIAGSTTFGVAKHVTLHPVRVVDCGGWGMVSNVIAGIDWLTARHQAPGSRRAVVNISLNNSFSEPLELAVSASIAQGIVYVVAAGNDGDGSACYLSPQRLPESITVGASTEAGSRWEMSNNGPCVDLFAPGADIVSTFPIDDTSAIAMTGTSMAAPHVAGAAALYLAANPQASPAQVQAAIVEAATGGVLEDIGENTANRLLFSAAAEEQTTPDVFASGFEEGFSGWSGVTGAGDELN